MKINWVLSGSRVDAYQGTIGSTLASYRYRALLPLQALEARGHVCRMHELSPGAGTADHPALREADLVIFGKNHSEQHDVIALLDHARVGGVASVVDICDDYFVPGDKLAPYYRALASKADLVTASSFRLASSIEGATDANVCVVEDAYEGPSGTPRFTPELPKVKALWFGTPFNLASLLAEIRELPQRIADYQLDLRVLTSECPGLVEAFQQMNSRNGAKLTLGFKEWSLERNWTELESCDLVVTTVDQQRQFFMAKGSNRLIETLRAGRFPIVHPLPAYQEFDKWAWVGADIAAGMA